MSIIPETLLKIVPISMLRAALQGELHKARSKYFNAICSELDKRGYKVKYDYDAYNVKYRSGVSREYFDKFIDMARRKGYMLNAFGYIKSKNWRFWKLENKTWVYNKEGIEYDTDAQIIRTVQ